MSFGPSGVDDLSDICLRSNCGKDAEYQVCGEVYAAPGIGQPAQLASGIVVCAEHQDVNLKELFPQDSDGWHAICHGFIMAGRQPPDWNTLRTVLKPLV